jgi:hypothetical protein
MVKRHGYELSLYYSSCAMQLLYRRLDGIKARLDCCEKSCRYQDLIPRLSSSPYIDYATLDHNEIMLLVFRKPTPAKQYTYTQFFEKEAQILRLWCCGL